MNTTRQQSFDQKEIRERQLITLYYKYKCEAQGNCLDIELCDEKYSSFDAMANLNGKPYIMIEAKVREQYTYQQIEQWGGSFLELTKLIGLLKKQAEEGLDTPLHYINFFKDKVIVYELPKDISSYKWEMKNLQKDDYDKNPIWKHVTKLDDLFIVENKGRKH